MRCFSPMKSVPIPMGILMVACSVITEKGSDTIVFSHHLHSEQGLGCSDCHGGVVASDSKRRESIPQKSECSECHDVEGDGSCAMCHRNPKSPAPWSEPGETFLNFSHKAHVEAGAECEDCHRNAAHWPDFMGQKGQSKLGHGECAACHKPDLDNADCKKCHINLDVNAQKASDVYKHDPGFFKTHGIKAEGGASTCAECHDQSYCVECHDGNAVMRPSLRFPERVERSFMHRGDWVTRHPLEARFGDPACMKCHGTSFCSSCHERNGVGGAFGERNPHLGKANWIHGKGPESHGRAARRRIGECAACHDQGASSNCVECHSEKGIHSFNPHPPGWNPPTGRGERTSHKMCRICHIN